MKTLMKMSATLWIILGLTAAANAQGTYSGQAVKESLEASSHAVQGIAYSAASAGQVVSGIVAVPFIVIGESGKVSAQIGQDLWDASTATVQEPLEISDKTITVGPPPDKALNL